MAHLTLVIMTARFPLLLLYLPIIFAASWSQYRLEPNSMLSQYLPSTKKIPFEKTTEYSHSWDNQEMVITVGQNHFALLYFKSDQNSSLKIYLKFRGICIFKGPTNQDCSSLVLWTVILLIKNIEMHNQRWSILYKFVNQKEFLPNHVSFLFMNMVQMLRIKATII